MFERLLLCDFAVADLTTANANVFYELGVRHTARPATTVTIFAEQQPIPFDINFLRSLPYGLGKNNKFPAAMANKLRAALKSKLEEMRELAVQSKPVDSPLFQLIGEWQPGKIARLKTDTCREQVKYNEDIKQQLGEVRAKAKNRKTHEDAQQQLAVIRSKIGALDAAENGTVIDLMLGIFIDTQKLTSSYATARRKETTDYSGEQAENSQDAIMPRPRESLISPEAMPYCHCVSPVACAGPSCVARIPPPGVPSSTAVTG